MFENLIEKLKKNPTTLVFTEGPDPRILEAASRLKKEGILEPLLVGNPEEVQAAAAKGGFDITDIRIVDPANYRRMDELVEKMVELRKGKMSPEECKAALLKGNYFGTMLVKLGVADCLLGGATYSTADTVRQDQARQQERVLLLRSGPREGRRQRGEVRHGRLRHQHRALRRGDGRVRHRVRPHRPDLRHRPQGGHAELLHQGLRQGREGGQGGGGPEVDAAFSPVVAQTKCKGSPVAGQANVFIFPEIQAGNIGYKIAQRLGGFAAYGPILQGLNAPINDLSRGCDAEEVYNMAIITAGLK